MLEIVAHTTNPNAVIVIGPASAYVQMSDWIQLPDAKPSMPDWTPSQLICRITENITNQSLERMQ